MHPQIYTMRTVQQSLSSVQVRPPPRRRNDHAHIQQTTRAVYDVILARVCGVNFSRELILFFFLNLICSAHVFHFLWGCAAHMQRRINNNNIYKWDAYRDVVRRRGGVHAFSPLRKLVQGKTWTGARRSRWWNKLFFSCSFFLLI